MVGMIEAYEDRDGLVTETSDSPELMGNSGRTYRTGVTGASATESQTARDPVRESVEEENLREEDADEGEASTVPGLGITWPKLWCHGLRGRVRVMEQKVNLQPRWKVPGHRQDFGN